MTAIDPSWAALGRSDNAAFFAALPRVLVVAPDDGCTDDEQTARQSLMFQREHWQRQGTPGAAVVLMDRVAHQTKAARRVYQTDVDLEWVTGFGLVTHSVFGRAVASVFMGLTQPPVPTRMFGKVEQALHWASGLPAKADGR
ncbi:MAG: hypothetical protein K0V04_15270 [Deltaproteobacteria bacterium]|nr:hypothetical protein [Deltaproteobacteria bacterium]